VGYSDDDENDERFSEPSNKEKSNPPKIPMLPFLSRATE
jgi:hypothetical protein